MRALRICLTPSCLTLPGSHCGLNQAQNLDVYACFNPRQKRVVTTISQAVQYVGSMQHAQSDAACVTASEMDKMLVPADK